MPSTLGGKPVTRICEGAFGNCSGLREIAIPDSVVTIGYGAFVGCTNLVKMTIGSGLESIPQYDSIFGWYEISFIDENGEVV
ncbi:MAG: leucine-rich repeat protein, partial [Kiritimatiellae bacterium]|nr:leucine-rich repeat protein [Kiritimatiellia bacterium]